MAIRGLDHYTIGTADLERAAAFYEQALGLERGPRPDFDFPGVWLYAGGRPIVHLFVNPAFSDRRTGALDHISLAADNMDETLKRLDRMAIGYKRLDVPGTDRKQVFLHDHDGIRIELSFGTEEVTA